MTTTKRDGTTATETETETITNIKKTRKQRDRVLPVLPVPTLFIVLFVCTGLTLDLIKKQSSATKINPAFVSEGLAYNRGPGRAIEPNVLLADYNSSSPNEGSNETFWRTFDPEMLRRLNETLIPYNWRLDFKINYHYPRVNTLHEQLVQDFYAAETRWDAENKTLEPPEIAKKYGLIRVHRGPMCRKVFDIGHVPAASSKQYEPDLKIPKLLFQSWHTSTLNPILCEHVKSWTKTNRDFDYFLFDDAAAQRFIELEYGSRIAEAFSCVKIGAALCDVWRVLILYKYGGIYMDFDVAARKSRPFRKWGFGNRTVITSNGWGCAGSFHFRKNFGCPHQWAMIYSPRHPILREAVLQILSQLASKSATQPQDVAFYPYLRAFWIHTYPGIYMPEWKDNMNFQVQQSKPHVKLNMLSSNKTHWGASGVGVEMQWHERCLIKKEGT